MVQSWEVPLVVSRLILNGAPKVSPLQWVFKCMQMLLAVHSEGVCIYKAFILHVLLSSWLTAAKLGRPKQTYDILDIFAGHARLSSTSRMVKLRAAAIDLQYDCVVGRKGGMDLTTAAGFTYCVCNGNVEADTCMHVCALYTNSHMLHTVMHVHPD